jgi:hypothetical protein
MSVNADVHLGHDFAGEKVDVLVPSTTLGVDKLAHLMYILISQLYRLIVVDGHNANRITVLFNVLFTGKPQQVDYRKLFLQLIDNTCSVRNGEEVSKNGIVFDTIRRYSGEQNDIIIGFCPEYYPSGFQNNNALMVTLCSRAKLKLILILEDVNMALRFKLANWKNIKYGNLHAVNNFAM